MYHFCCCAQYFRCFCSFICILWAFIISLCDHSILMIFFISGGSSCIMFCCCAQYFRCFCTFMCILCAFVISLCAHSVLKIFLKSTNISLCAMSRLDLVTFRFSVECRCAIGIVAKWCDFPPCDVTFLHLAIPLGDVTFLRVMWLKPGACNENDDNNNNNPGPSKGCQFNSKGWWIDTPLGTIWHPFEGAG